MLRRISKPALAIFFLLLAAILSVVVSGYVDLKKAEEAQLRGEYQSAVEFYARAARILIWRADLYEQAGISAALSGDFPASIVYFEKGKIQTEEGWVWYCTAKIERKDYASALSVCSLGTRHFDTARLYRLLAFVHRELGDWEGERSALENQTRLDPADAYAAYRFGLLLTLFSPEDALPELTRASTLNPEVDSAVQTLRAAVEISEMQNDPSIAKVVIGQAFGLVQDWELAKAAFEDAVRLDEENAEAWAWLGEAKQQTGQDGAADLDRALSLNRESVNVRALRALYWSRQGRYERMFAEYIFAAGIEPENPRWRAGIGEAHAKSGDLISALEAYQMAVELDPANSEYWRLLAVFCADYSVQVEEIGLPAALQAVAFDESNVTNLDALGYLYLSSGRYASAIQTLTAIVESSPGYYPAHIHLGMAYLGQGDRIAAFNTFTFVRDSAGAGVYAETANQLLARYFP
jgi:tetratricopeptide (TPR) repeat protein